MDENSLYWFFGIIIGILTFFSCWIYAVSEWGFLLGFGLGWIPSLFIGIIAGVIGPFLVLLALFVFAFIYVVNR